MIKLDTLYKKTSKGAVQICNISVENAVVTVQYGQLNGKMQEKTTTCKGKNPGKANATTDEEQAVKEAKAKHSKKIKSGYSTNPACDSEVLLPMKVSVYQDHKNKIKFPAFVSPKLNGCNCEYRLVDGVLKLYSRGGEEYPIPPHQEKDILTLMEASTTESLNGEMYCHGEHLQDIMAATKKHNDLTPRLRFWIFDFPLIPGTYNDRCTEAYAKVAGVRVFTDVTAPLVPVQVARSFEEIDAMHEEVTSQGYEGLIVRNPLGLYEYNKRSLNVFKYKTVQDAEFEVCGYSIDKNGHVVFSCKIMKLTAGMEPTPTFKVKLKGTNEERLAMAAEAGNYIGKWLKVDYETLSKDGIPLKPVGIMFREVDDNGEATE